MSENKRAIATDLKRLDGHVVQPGEYEDAPELTDEQLVEADVHEGGRLVRRGRPLSPNRKVPVKFRIDPDVLAAYRASGPGWQTRMNNDLRKAVMRKAGASKAMARKVMRVRRARKAAKKSSRARA